MVVVRLEEIIIAVANPVTAAVGQMAIVIPLAEREHARQSNYMAGMGVSHTA